MENSKQEALTTQTRGDVYAALDIGSNSFHLIVARIVDGSIQTLHKVKQRVRMARGLSADGYLDEDAMLRGLDTLSQMATTLKDIPQKNVRVVATYTLRAAKNADQFINRAKAVFPYRIETIPGTEEARLIYQGVAHTVSGSGKRLVIDIGGGSTEFIIGEKFNPIQLNSRSMGCVSFTNQFFGNNKITEQAFQKAIIQAELELEEILEKYLNTGWETCFGTSGTIKAIREAIKQAGWSEGEIQPKHLEKLKQMLISFGHIDKIDIPGVSEHRVPVIAGGLAVLIAAFEFLNIECLNYSDAALREGVLYEMQGRFQHHDIRERTVESMRKRYYVDVAQSERVSNTALKIYEAVKVDWKLEDETLHSLLKWAAKLHEVGLHIHSTGYHKHSAYILQFADLPGFNTEEQILLASLVRYQRKKIKLEELHSFTMWKVSRVVRLIRILRLATMINLRRRDDLIPDMQVRTNKEALEIQFASDYLANEPLLNADLTEEQLLQQHAGFELVFS